MAILLVAAVLGAIGTVIGLTNDGGTTATEQELESTIATLTAERSDLVAEVAQLQATIDSFEVERDAAIAQVSELESTVDTLTADSDGGAAPIASLEATIATRTGQRDDLVAQVAELESTIDDLTADRDDLVAEVSQLESDLAAQTKLAGTAVAERNALAEMFPIEFDASIQDVDLVGTYDVDLSKAYCDGLTTCATLPSVDELTIRETPEGYLELVIDDYVTAGMLRVDGAFYAVAGSTTAVAACAGTARVARVAVTLYAHGLSIADDGSSQYTDLGASLTVEAPAVAGCSAALAFYGANVTPQA